MSAPLQAVKLSNTGMAAKQIFFINLFALEIDGIFQKKSLGTKVKKPVVDHLKAVVDHKDSMASFDSASFWHKRAN